MSWAHALAFAAACLVFLPIPGPTVLLVISYALAHGRRAALAMAAGVALGDFTALTASLLGMGAVLSASAAVFAVLRWIGGAYLVWLGIRLWRAPVAETPETAAPDTPPLHMAAHAYAVTALNPKSIVFFIAFVPQFIDQHSPYAPQAIEIVAIFVTLAAINAGLYALLAATARARLRRRSVRRAMNRTGGTLLAGAGLLAITFGRA
jgi:threonine/homoserine/homoserine lactone efflux protein